MRFQQTDVWRHMGEVTHLIAKEIHHVEKNVLVAGEMADRKLVTVLESSWALYQQLPTSGWFGIQ